MSTKVNSAQRALVYDCNQVQNDPVLNCRFAPNSIPITSIHDMVSKLEEKNTVFDIVVLCGHGAPSFHSVGSGNGSVNYTKGKDLLAGRLNDVAESIHRLRNLMYKPVTKTSRNPILFIAGCNVGGNDSYELEDEVPLLKELSEKMQNVCVVASSLEVAPFKRKDISNHAVQLRSARNAKDIGPMNLIHCTAYLNGERLESSAELLAKTRYRDYNELVEDLTFFD